MSNFIDTATASYFYRRGEKDKHFANVSPNGFGELIPDGGEGFSRETLLVKRGLPISWETLEHLMGSGTSIAGVSLRNIQTYLHEIVGVVDGTRDVYQTYVRALNTAVPTSGMTHNAAQDLLDALQWEKMRLRSCRHFEDRAHEHIAAALWTSPTQEMLTGDELNTALHSAATYLDELLDGQAFAGRSATQKVELLKGSPYRNVYKMSAVACAVSNCLNLYWTQSVGIENFKETSQKYQTDFITRCFDAGYVQPTPWHGIPTELARVLVDRDNGAAEIETLSYFMYLFQALVLGEYNLAARLLQNLSYITAREGGLFTITTQIDFTKTRKTLSNREKRALNNMMNRYTAISAWLSTGRKVVEITRDSFETLFDVALNRADQNKTPIRFEDCPRPTNKYFKHMVCFKFTNTVIDTVRDIASHSARTQYQTEYANRIPGVDTNFGKPTRSESTTPAYVFVASYGDVLDEKLIIIPSARPGRPVGTQAGLGLCFSFPYVLPELTTNITPETNRKNPPRAFVDAVDAGITSYKDLSKRRFEEARRAAIDAVQDDSRYANLTPKLQEKLIDQTFTFGTDGHLTQRIWCKDSAELAVVAANALAAMAQGVTLMLPASAKRRKGSRGARNARKNRKAAKVMRLDSKGLRTYSRRVTRIPGEQGRSQQRKPMVVHQVKGHPYRVWVVSPEAHEKVLAVRERRGKTPGYLYCVIRRDGKRGRGYTRGECITEDRYSLRQGIDDLGLT